MIIQYLVKPSDLKRYLEDILIEGECEEDDPELNAVLFNQLLERLDLKLFNELSEFLSEEEVEGILSLLKTNPSAAEVQGLLLELLPDVSEITTRVLTEFREFYV
ncbi:MAG: hypothetical protein D6719_11945 [Candidatus Dadabacteria bacterium]|nr:MAG: hypothetical protein D6719_11945 [Candidatus Dadabacteria bacterium]